VAIPVQPPKPLTVVSFGGKGTGKTAGMLQRVARDKPARLVVFDFKNDPALMALGTPYTWGERAKLARVMLKPKFCARLLVDHSSEVDPVEQFEWLCRAVWMAGNLTFWVDELPEVTKPGRAPPAWRRLVNVGRDYTLHDGTRAGIALLTTGQRMAECDKSVISNADIIRTGRLANPEDARLMGKTLGVRPEEVLRLPDLHWVEKRADTPEATRGVLTFSNRKQPQAAKKPPPKPGRK
jgi:hypothetical protein